MGNGETTEIGDLLASARDAARRNDLEEASRLLEQVIARSPDELQALDLLGFARFFQG